MVVTACTLDSDDDSDCRDTSKIMQKSRIATSSNKHLKSRKILNKITWRSSKEMKNRSSKDQEAIDAELIEDVG